MPLIQALKGVPELVVLFITGLYRFTSRWPQLWCRTHTGRSIPVRSVFALADVITDHFRMLVSFTIPGKSCHHQVISLNTLKWLVAIDIPDDAITAISDALVNQQRLFRLKFEQYDESRRMPAVLSLLEAKPTLLFSTGYNTYLTFSHIPTDLWPASITFSSKSQLHSYISNNSLTLHKLTGIQTTFGKKKRLHSYQ